MVNNIIVDMPYISPQNKNDLLNYKYSGYSDSITYNYIWSPMDEYLVQFFPTWVAPNLITLSAFMILLVTHVIFMLPDEGDVIPDWKLILMAISITLYQHLDSMDGKQARRTKSSSSLGMLLDHGADAVASFLIALQFCKIFQLSYELSLFTIYIFIMKTEFCAMWSQYCVGYFRLGVINPVDEGLPFYSITCLVVTQLDISKFGEYHIFGTYCEEIIIVGTILFVFSDYSLSKDIFNKAIKSKAEVYFMPILYLIGGLCIIVFYISIEELTTELFYSFFYSLMFMWSYNMIIIQLKHILAQKYKVFNIATNLLIAMVGFFGLAGKYLPCSPAQYFTVCAVLQGLVFVQFCTSVLREGAKVLNIRLFSLKPRQKNC